MFGRNKLLYLDWNCIPIGRYIHKQGTIQNFRSLLQFKWFLSCYILYSRCPRSREDRTTNIRQCVITTLVSAYTNGRQAWLILSMKERKIRHIFIQINLDLSIFQYSILSLPPIWNANSSDKNRESKSAVAFLKKKCLTI